MSALTAQRLRKSLPHLNLTRTIFSVAAVGLLAQQILEEPRPLLGAPLWGVTPTSPTASSS